MRDKQIEEMTKDLCDIQCNGMRCNICDTGCEWRMLAIALYNAGYRKASKIFEEIEESIANLEYKVNTPRKTVKVEELKAQVNWILHEVVPNTIAELTKKYESEV